MGRVARKSAGAQVVEVIVLERREENGLDVMRTG